MKNPFRKAKPTEPTEPADNPTPSKGSIVPTLKEGVQVEGVYSLGDWELPEGVSIPGRVSINGDQTKVAYCAESLSLGVLADTKHGTASFLAIQLDTEDGKSLYYPMLSASAVDRLIQNLVDTANKYRTDREVDQWPTSPTIMEGRTGQPATPAQLAELTANNTPKGFSLGKTRGTN